MIEEAHGRHGFAFALFAAGRLENLRHGTPGKRTQLRDRRQPPRSQAEDRLNSFRSPATALERPESPRILSRLPEVRWQSSQNCGPWALRESGWEEGWFACFHSPDGRSPAQSAP